MPVMLASSGCAQVSVSGQRTLVPTAALGSRPQRAVPQCAPARSSCKSRQLTVTARADSRSSNDGSFIAGFLVGGVLCGTLGFLFAPQISKSLLGNDQRLRLPRFMEDELPKDPEQTKQDLIEKIAQLNASIDEVASQLKVKDDNMMGKAESDGMKIVM